MSDPLANKNIQSARARLIAAGRMADSTRCQICGSQLKNGAKYVCDSHSDALKAAIRKRLELDGGGR